MPSSVVLSYASVDRDRALAVRDALGLKGINIWMDRTDILPGADWQKSIESAIRECQVLVVLLTQAAIGSREVQAEWSLALALGKSVAPVLMERNLEVPFRLATLQFVEIDPDSMSASIDSLANILPRIDAPLSRLLNWDDAYEAKSNEPKRYMEITLWLEDSEIAMGAKRNLLVDRRRFGTIKSLLDHIYLAYLSRKVKPYSYGADWILSGTVAVVPFKWISNPGSPIESVDLEWISKTPLSSLSVLDDWGWGIISKRALRKRLRGGVFGALANNPSTIRALQAHPKTVGHLLGCPELFEVVAPTAAEPHDYKFQMVQFAWFSELAGKVFRETQSAARSDEDLRKRWEIASHLA